MEKNLLRPPVVVVIGHVDHGKTSLLDAIRKTSVTKREAGGITQSIGASVAKTTDGSDITFIDTPGHALFGSMRARGLNLADVGILVVAMDDGVQPQTKEAIKLLQESALSFIVAITKNDLPGLGIESVLGQLEKEGVFFEKRGGDTSYISVSSRTGDGIKELLELISLVSEMSGMKGNSNEELSGFVIETVRDKRGLLVSVVLKSGKIKIGDTIYAGNLKARVKGIFDDNVKTIKSVDAGYPAQILGFDELPSVGALLGTASQNTENKPTFTKATASQEESKVKIFVKAKTTGSLEALLASVPSEVYVIGSGVGDVNESDIFYAKAAHASIFLFEAKFASTIRRLAETENVKIERFDVIYDLIKALSELIEKDKEEINGRAQILASFPFNSKRIAGSKILQGKFTKSPNNKLMRGDTELGRVRIISIKKQKEEVGSVSQGEECGILFEPQLDFRPGDVILSVTNNK